MVAAIAALIRGHAANRICLSLFSSTCSFLLALPSYLFFFNYCTSEVEKKGLQPRITPYVHGWRYGGGGGGSGGWGCVSRLTNY